MGGVRFFPPFTFNQGVMVPIKTGLPKASTRNGTYTGLRNEHFAQDFFLGMRYALPPTGDLRFNVPHPLNVSWTGSKNAQSYGPHCLSYGSDRSKFRQSEDCLTINVVRPHIGSPGLLPVGVYFYGGGNTGGGSSDPRYNLSFIVSKATAMNKPFIAVSFNYRSSIWGFISGNQVSGTGNTNLGLRDQRLALHWIQENIEAFGGNPSKVTIWGGSSGASSVGVHLIAFGGRDDNLFRAAIMQSGSPLVETALPGFAAQNAYRELTQLTGCSQTEDTLQCLRDVPPDDLDFIVESLSEDNPLILDALSLPTLDGDIIKAFPSLLLQAAAFVRVPIIIGTTTNEGSSFVPGDLEGPENLERYLAREFITIPQPTLKWFAEVIKGAWLLPNVVVQNLLSLYPPPQSDIKSLDFAEGLDNAIFFQAAELLGDLVLIASHRLTCETFSKHAKCFSFRFDALASGGDTVLGAASGVTHGAEIGPVFQNTDGFGFKRNPFLNQSQCYFKMSELMGEMWINFITDMNPNGSSERSIDDIIWPAYDLQSPLNMVFGDPIPWRTEMDTRRSEAVRYINRINSGVMGR
uniref:Carboxylic ester hydrolase n=1 Tax=Talaromyces marneffei PM1 TaxID=1077442 RepID=A0A093VKE5_TALMA